MTPWELHKKNLHEYALECQEMRMVVQNVGLADLGSITTTIHDYIDGFPVNGPVWIGDINSGGPDNDPDDSDDDGIINTAIV